MSGSLLLPSARIFEAYALAKAALLAQITPAGHWEGELSTSALSTATACLALELVRRADSDQFANLAPLITSGAAWLAAHQNEDGGWGDTVKSFSNISTSMLCHATLHAAACESYGPVLEKANAYIQGHGGVPAVKRRYGTDHTFSVPILTHCALAGLVDWREIPALPFELACIPHRFYKTVRLPVVSYALPALIAIGQVRHHHQRPAFAPWGWVRDAAITPSLKKLESIQPPSGGFLEATPLTAFVTMSLAGMGRANHPVARKGVEFLVRSVRPDGSWPIDTNLATWVTTLSINALDQDLPMERAPVLREWLLNQQYRSVHPYTQAEPGGWAWTDLSGGVPDADDTPGAVLAVSVLQKKLGDSLLPLAVDDAVRWLVDLQNRDGGWPTFCRGWGKLPFDRSSPDLTAHTLRALVRWKASLGSEPWERIPDRRKRELAGRTEHALSKGLQFLQKTQQPDGSWLPLWFGNQHAPDDINPTYGTAKVMASLAAVGWADTQAGRQGLEWLFTNQNDDGGWGGRKETPSSVEETTLALDVLLDPRAWPKGDVQVVASSVSVRRGLNWLLDAVDAGTFMEPSPIGFYFAKLWYFEKLYPLIFTVSALRRAAAVVSRL